jgi:hypothetical protein
MHEAPVDNDTAQRSAMPMCATWSVAASMVPQRPVAQVRPSGACIRQGRRRPLRCLKLVLLLMDMWVGNAAALSPRCIGSHARAQGLGKILAALQPRRPIHPDSSTRSWIQRRTNQIRSGYMSWGLGVRDGSGLPVWPALVTMLILVFCGAIGRPGMALDSLLLLNQPLSRTGDQNEVLTSDTVAFARITACVTPASGVLSTPRLCTHDSLPASSQHTLLAHLTSSHIAPRISHTSRSRPPSQRVDRQLLIAAPAELYPSPSVCPSPVSLLQPLLALTHLYR